jgi:hypothetical protein
MNSTKNVAALRIPSSGNTMGYQRRAPPPAPEHRAYAQGKVSGGSAEVRDRYLTMVIFLVCVNDAVDSV